MDVRSSPRGCEAFWLKKQHKQRHDHVRRPRALGDCQTVRAQAAWRERHGVEGREKVREGLWRVEHSTLCLAVCIPTFPGRWWAAWGCDLGLTNGSLASGRMLCPEQTPHKAKR